MQNTEYRFLPLPQGAGAGAQTNSADSVFINTNGVFVTATDGMITLGGQRYNLFDPSNVRGMILLHELGHQLGIFGPDLGSPENAAHSVDILKHCFPGYSFPVR